MPDSIRSATVRLEAQVAKYIADMERAGKATDDAFSRSSVAVARTNKNLDNTTRITGEMRAETDQAATSLNKLREETSGYAGELRSVNGATDHYVSSMRKMTQEGPKASRVQTKLASDVEQTNRSMGRGQKGLDSYTDRLGLLASSIGAVGPALVPLGGLAIGGLAGLANDAGAAAVAGGSLIVAFHGVGKALAAVNKAAIDPTAANLAAAKLQMEQLSPATRQFVREFQDMRPLLAQVQAAAASGWFPGLDTALKELRPLAPVIGKIFHDVGTMGGKLAAEGAKSLAGPEWAKFFSFIDQQAPRAMAALGKVVGSLAHGLAGLWMAFSPVDNGFNRWLVDAAHSFDTWASGLSKTQGFQDFVDYLQQNGPKVAQAVGAIASALVQIVQAAAPLAGPTLQAITGIANAIGAIANSPLGTPILTIIQLASAMRLLKAATGGLGSARSGIAGISVIGPTLDRALPSMTRFRAGLTNMRAGLKEVNSLGGGPLNLFNSAARRSSVEAERFGKGLRGMAVEGFKAAGPIAAVGLATSGATDKLGMTNTASLALAGTLGGPLGVAAGATIGLALDIGSAFGKSGDQIRAANDAIKSANLDQITTQLQALQQQQAQYTAANQGGTAHGFWDGVGKALDEMKYGVTHPFAKNLSDQIHQLSGAQEAAQAAAERLRVKQLGLSRSFVEVAHSAGMTGSEFAALTAQTNLLKDATLGAFSAETSYREALVAAQKQAGTNSAGIHGSSAAALKNREALANLADAWDKNVDAMRANGASIDVMNRRFGTARAAFVKTAVAMGIPIEKARELATALLHIPGHLNTVVRLSGADSARAAIAQLRADMANPIIQNVIVRHHGQSYTGPGTGGGGGSTNSLVTGGIKKAAGGLITGPGGPRDDLIPARLSNLEYVMPADAVAHYGVGFMDTLRARRFADGGYAGTAPGPSRTYVRTNTQQDPGWKNLHEHLKATTKELARETSARTALIDKMHQLSSSVQDGLRTDLFGTGNVWASQYGGTSPGGVMSTLHGDNANIRSEIDAIKTLRSKGVTGDALGAILSQGGLAGAKAFAQLSRTELAAYERLYRRRDRLLHTVGSLAGTAAYGSQISAENHELKAIRAELAGLRRDVKAADQHNRAGHNGTKDGIKGAASSAGRHHGRRP